jgi:phage-related protein
MKPLHWVASSLKDVRSFPEDVKDGVGFALHLAQTGEMAFHATPMMGFGGAKVIEVVVDSHGDTYRAVYTVKFAKAVYVLHVFQKKSKRGIATPRPDMSLIHERLRTAETHYKQTYGDVEQRGRRDEHGA